MRMDAPSTDTLFVPDESAGDAIVVDAMSDDTSPADAASCDLDPCRLLPPQCGCPAGEVCQYTAALGIHCTAPGPLPADALCTDEEQCAASLTCFWSSRTLGGLCVPWCSTDSDCPSGSCVRAAVVSQTGVCTHPCDPRDPMSCPSPDLACRLISETRWEDGASVQATFCIATGTRTTGTACTSARQCVAGLTCVSGLCVPYCVVGAGDCAGGTTCTPTATVGSTTYGGCR